jgi:hypothetical protein
MRTSEIAQELLDEFMARDRAAQDVQSQVGNDPHAPHFEAIPQALPPRAGGINFNVQASDPCPNWNVRIAEGAADKIQLFYDNPGTVGGIMPEFDGDPLDDDPQPQITIPDAAGTYLVYFRFEWEPDVEEESPGVWIQTGGGTMIEIEVVVAPFATPPTDVDGTIDGATGNITANWEQHRRVTSVERVSGGALELNQHDLCHAMESAICYNKVRIGRI